MLSLKIIAKKKKTKQMLELLLYKEVLFIFMIVNISR